MTKEKKIPDEPGIRIPDPMQPLFDFMKGMDYMRPTSLFMNFRLEGSFVTFYMPLEAKLQYESMLLAKGYKCDMTKQWAIDRGYPRNDFYFRCGPYQMRLSVWSEFRERQKRMLEGGRL